MKVDVLAIPAVKVLTPRRFSDNRGWFSESYNRNLLKEAGIDLDFVQDNHSFSANVGTVRGLHYQSPPFAQDKLVRVIRGSVLDVVVDVRDGSPTQGQWVSVELSAKNGMQLFVPVGFLHGFITQEPDTELVYKVTDYYSSECDGAVRWDDPDLKIDWGSCANSAVLSSKDQSAASYRDFMTPFSYL